MALTTGKAPFGRNPSGSFNFTREGPATVLYWEDFPKRVRVVFNKETIADSLQVKALHETGHLMVLYFPKKDVDMSRLNATDHHTKCPYKGRASYWTVQVGDRVAENAVWSYEDPVDSAPPIDGYMAFIYEKMDAWYQEDEQVYAHPRNPYHRFDVHDSSRHVVVRYNAAIIAETNRPRLMFETGLPVRYYLPEEDVRTDLLNVSKTVSQCPYKGESRHWHLSVDGETIEDAGWTLAEPIGEGTQVADHICFYPDKVDIEVDGKHIQE